jgi:hypothetical protein
MSRGDAESIIERSNFSTFWFSAEEVNRAGRSALRVVKTSRTAHRPFNPKFSALCGPTVEKQMSSNYLALWRIRVQVFCFDSWLSI